MIVLDVEKRDGLVERIRRRAFRSNRFDDAGEEVIRQRLQVYEEQAEELLDHVPGPLPRQGLTPNSRPSSSERIIGVVKEALERF